MNDDFGSLGLVAYLAVIAITALVARVGWHWAGLLIGA